MVRKMSVTETERPEEFWVDALPKHVVDVMHGKDVEARFRDAITQDWTSVRKLKGWSKSGFDDVFYDGSSAWIFCQVYEPQSWWLERPDPGPEWRLLGKFPGEELKPGDEIWLSTKRWALSCSAEAGEKLQQKDAWYRRRIEVEPEPKYKVDDRVRIIGPVPGCTLVGRIVRVKSRRLSVLGDGSSVWFYTVENTYEYVVREDYLAPAPPAPPSHPMCRCEIATEQIKPVEGAAHYTLKVGDTISTPSGRQAIVTEHGIEVS
jgi:hypothetical protein